MVKNGRRVFEAVLDIPEGESGKFAIRHVWKEPGAPVPASNLRTAAFRGQANKDLRFDHSTRWHSLLEDDGVWMTDYPIEQIQHDESLRGFRGRVLVGGLGIGYAVTALAAMSRVKEVVVVEISEDVIKLVWPHLSPETRLKTTLVHADLFDALKEFKAHNQHFLHGFYDIWASDGENTFHNVVMPLRELSRGVVASVECWNEDVMRGQLFHALLGRMLMIKTGIDSIDYLCTPYQETYPDAEAEAAAFHDWAIPFWKMVRDGEFEPDEQQPAAVAYAQCYGRGSERAWGNSLFIRAMLRRAKR